MLPLITPTILTNNLEDLKEQLKKVEKDFSSVQIDVMDGIFVDNQSFTEREQVNDLNSEAYFELHLMVKDPISEIGLWSNVANVTNVIFHIESDVDAEECIRHIRKHGWKAGIALNPETPLSQALPYLKLVDELMFMTVHPGQQGSVFTEEVLEKIKEFKKLNLDITCSADGGINEHTIKSIVEAGAEKLYVGSAIMSASDVEVAHEKLIQAIGETTI